MNWDLMRELHTTKGMDQKYVPVLRSKQRVVLIDLKTATLVQLK
jgi:hypothetical protein